MSHPGLLFDRSEWDAWKATGGAGKPPFPPIAVMPTWSDAAIVDSVLPHTFVIVERMYDRDNNPTHKGCGEFLTLRLGPGVLENAGRAWEWIQT